MALGSIATGACAGAGTVAAGLVVFRASLDAALPLVLFAGIGVAAALAWTLARPIADWWRRGVTAAVAVFAAMLLAGATAPADMAGGPTGVAAFGALAFLAAAAAGRYALRSRTRGW